MSIEPPRTLQPAASPSPNRPFTKRLIPRARVSSSGRADLEEEKGRLKGSSAGKAVYEDEGGQEGPYLRARWADRIPHSGRFLSLSKDAPESPEPRVAKTTSCASAQHTHHLIQKHLTVGSEWGGAKFLQIIIPKMTNASFLFRNFA